MQQQQQQQLSLLSQASRGRLDMKPKGIHDITKISSPICMTLLTRNLCLNQKLQSIQMATCCAYKIKKTNEKKNQMNQISRFQFLLIIKKIKTEASTCKFPKPS
jgi:hypothetical protein